jgi:hypothetical protein
MIERSRYILGLVDHLPSFARRDKREIFFYTPSLPRVRPNLYLFDFMSPSLSTEREKKRVRSGRGVGH